MKARLGFGTSLAIWIASTGVAFAVAEMEPSATDEASAVAEEPMEPELEVPSEDSPAPPAMSGSEQTAPTQGRVARSTFALEVRDREPAGALESLENDTTEVAYFTELRDLEGQTVTHRWEFGGNVMAEVPFEVGAARWRVNSTKTLDPSWLGTWTVAVVDSTGRELSRQSFEYVAGGGAAAAVPRAPEVEAADETATPAAPAEAQPATSAAP